MAGKMQAVLLLATIVIAAISGICSAATYTVGGNTGWTIPTSASFYSNWASSQTFQVGDVLVFNFPANAHTVAEVSRANYNSCGTSNTIGAPVTNSPARITLKTAGTHYFICTIPGHCGANQKLAVTVTGPSSSSPATSPASSPTPAGGAAAPAAGPTASSGGATSPAGGPTLPAAEGPGASAPPPAGNFAASTGVGLLSLVSVAVAALMA